jgi:hypothetical protein
MDRQKRKTPKRASLTPIKMGLLGFSNHSLGSCSARGKPSLASKAISIMIDPTMTYLQAAENAHIINFFC